jgi:hypothetical protein
MNESMSGNADDPNHSTSSISRIGAAAAGEYVEHPYWFALAVLLTAALALPQLMSSSNDAAPSAAPASNPLAQSPAVTRSMQSPSRSLTRSTEPANQSLSYSAEAPNPPFTPSAESQIPPVKFPNPFDPDEIFEFAPGTSKEDARAAVAEILRERARMRQSP